MEQKRQELLEKYMYEIMVDFSNSKEDYENTGRLLCPEFERLCVNSDPKLAVRVLESLYGENKLEILR